MSTKLAGNWRLIADPFADESVWLPACTSSCLDASFALVEHRAASPPSGRLASKLKSSCADTLRLATAIITSAVLAYAAYVAVQLGFDWGYKLVGKVFDQIAEVEQAITATYALAFAVMPLAFSFYFGFFKSLWSGSRRWYAAHMIVVISYCLVLCAPNGIDPLFRSISDLIPAVPGLFFGLIGLVAGERFYGALRRRLKMSPLLISGFVSLVPLMFYVWQNKATFVGGFCLYTLAIIAGSASAAFFARARDRAGAVLMSVVAFLPVIMANFLNVSGNLISFGLEHFKLGLQLGWRALLSACLITLVTFACVGAGGLIGFRCRDRH